MGKPYRTEAFVSDFGVIAITPWMRERLGNKRVMTRLSQYIHCLYTGRKIKAWVL